MLRPALTGRTTSEKTERSRYDPCACQYRRHLLPVIITLFVQLLTLAQEKASRVQWDVPQASTKVNFLPPTSTYRGRGATDDVERTSDPVYEATTARSQRRSFDTSQGVDAALANVSKVTRVYGTPAQRYSSRFNITDTGDTAESSPRTWAVAASMPTPAIDMQNSTNMDFFKQMVQRDAYKHGPLTLSQGGTSQPTTASFAIATGEATAYSNPSGSYSISSAGGFASAGTGFHTITNYSKAGSSPSRVLELTGMMTNEKGRSHVSLDSL